MLLLLLLLWSVILGLGLANAQDSRLLSAGGVDVVPERHQVGHELYLKYCGSCHVALPPAVMPSETWRQMLLSPEHFGLQITRPNAIEQRLIWNYMSAFSRPLLTEERTPYRLDQSRYLKALHPDVELPSRLRPNSCAACHPGASQNDFRSLSPEWQDAP